MIRVVSYRLNRVTPAGVTTPVYELTVGDSQHIQLPAEAWIRIAAAVKDDVDAMASGVLISAPADVVPIVKG